MEPGLIVVEWGTSASDFKPMKLIRLTERDTQTLLVGSKEAGLG
jgi:hypothetical protein